MDAHPVNIYDYEEIAKGKMGQGEYDFIAGGATDEITLRRTRAVFDAIMLRPRMMVDISQRDLRTMVLGQEIRFPIMLDPAGNHAAAHPEGELASVRAAGAAGTIMVLSAQSSRTLEEVAQAATGPLWFQSYFFKDRGLTLEMARRAEDAGYVALCLTLDAKVKPKRERNIRNNYTGPASPNYAHLNVTGSTWSFGLDGPTGANDLRDPASTWPDLDWLAAHTRLPLVVKGIMVGEDGRQAAEVYLDGGIRRGTDVFKALALGARAVLIGRPVFWGLAVEGETGVRMVLEMLRDELDATMGMCGRTTVASVDRECLVGVSPLLALFPQSAPCR
jgi:4-hydroxymandelate oxidase